MKPITKGNIQQFYSRGKLLLTGEYLVLKGAKALALPLNLGQKLTIVSSEKPFIDWITFEKETPVFTLSLNPNNLEIIETTNNDKAHYIQTLLKAAQALNSEFLYLEQGLAIKASIEFNMQWGLGTSSTLINNIAQWANINAFALNNQVSKGSGYDIACAQNSSPILYQIKNQKPSIQPCHFAPPFLQNLNLVYLNQKMGTEKNIAHFLNKNADYTTVNESIEKLSNQFLTCNDLSLFMQLMQQHEAIIASQINEIPVKEKLFPDFKGSIKSLGAWGGDFALVASALPFNEQKHYFETMGYYTFFPLNKVLESI